MLNIEELTAALNDPTSPMREKLLQHLELSPLDPAQAYQQVMQESKVELGGAPLPQMGQAENPGSLAGILGAEPAPLGLERFTPQVQDLSREQNPMGTVDLANSANVLPGEQGGMPQGGMDIGALSKMLEGLGGAGGDDYKAPPIPSASAPKGNNWNTFSAAQLQTPAVGRMPTLADLLNGRGK